MPSSSTTPHSVAFVRKAILVAGVLPVTSLLLWIWGHALTPYQVRYLVESRESGTVFRVSIYSTVDATEPLLVALDCHPDNLVDVTFRPVLAESRDWSLREMLPAVSDATAFLAGPNAASLDTIADRHLAGGLAEWEGMGTVQLRSRVKSLLRTFRRKLSQKEQAQIEDKFIDFHSSPDPHETSRLVLPARMKARDQAALRNRLDQLQQSWEKNVTVVTSNWLIRWQALTGTTLIVPSKGVGTTTPLYLSVPPLKQGAGLVLALQHQSPNPVHVVRVSMGEQDAFQVSSLKHFKTKSILLLLEKDWWRLMRVAPTRFF